MPVTRQVGMEPSLHPARRVDSGGSQVREEERPDAVMLGQVQQRGPVLDRGGLARDLGDDLGSQARARAACQEEQELEGPLRAGTPSAPSRGPRPGRSSTRAFSQSATISRTIVSMCSRPQQVTL